MARIKYIYDAEKCKYERVKVSFSEVILNIVAFLSLAFLFSVGLILIWSNYFKSPQEYALEKEVNYLTQYINRFDSEISIIDEILSDLEDRDANLYRTITGADSLSPEIRHPGIGGYSKYQNIKDLGLNSEDLIINKLAKVDELKREMKIQNRSYDDILIVAKNREKMLAAIPAIQPVSNKNLKRLASGWGMRTHPILKVKKFHWGIDFSAPRGTPIYATADGKIRFTKTNYGGYGKEIEIDHSFGYRTKYAHMQSFTVKKGQQVKRGEQIGTVGSTGRSTAPHLHYEVMYNNKKVNPVHYFFKDLNEKEYEVILKLASVENQSLS